MDQNAILHMVPNILLNFHPLLIGNFSVDSSKLEISIIRQHFISISYRFRLKRANGVKNNKNNFRDDIPYSGFFFRGSQIPRFSPKKGVFNLSGHLFSRRYMDVFSWDYIKMKF